jgi:hypothetical protein
MVRKGLTVKRRSRDPRNVLLGSRAQTHPACFESSDQYRDYIHLMRQSSNPKDTGVCMDCTPEFKTRMLEEGLCDHPETRFVLWRNTYEQEVEVVGISNQSRFWKRVQKGEAILNWSDNEEEDK